MFHNYFGGGREITPTQKYFTPKIILFKLFFIKLKLKVEVDFPSNMTKLILLNSLLQEMRFIIILKHILLVVQQ